MMATARSGAVLAALVVGAAACSVHGEPPAPQPITIVTGWTGGAFYPLGAALADLYNREIPGMNANAKFSGASAFNIQAIQSGKAEIGFSQGDVAYSAFKRGMVKGEEPYSHLRSMAVLYVNTAQFLVRKASGITSLADLRGRRIGVGGEPGSGTETAARTIIESYGLGYSDVQPEFGSFAEVAEGLRAGRIDAGIMVSSYPVTAISEIHRPAEVELLSVDDEAVHRIRSRFPFFKSVVIPRGTYEGQDKDVRTIGVDNLLICRDTLPESLVYEMTRLFFEALPRLAEDHVTARMIDAQQAPATPVPLHPGAARYYRERELFR
jgi:TRAP transporter TAXI family solute receptor